MVVLVSKNACTATMQCCRPYLKLFSQKSLFSWLGACLAPMQVSNLWRRFEHSQTTHLQPCELKTRRKLRKSKSLDQIQQAPLVYTLLDLTVVATNRMCIQGQTCRRSGKLIVAYPLSLQKSKMA